MSIFRSLFLVVVHCYLNNHSSHMFDKSTAFLKSRFGENCFWRERNDICGIQA